MVDFICMDLQDLLGARTENCTMNNACPQWVSNLGPTAYEVNTLCDELLELTNIDHLKVREKGRDLIQSCDKNPYTNRANQKAT